MLDKVLSSPLVRVALRYGLLSGILVMVFVVPMFYMGRHPFLINLFLDPRIPVLGVMIFIGLKELRDFYQGGSLYFAQGMVSSFLLTTICAVFCWLALLVFATINPEFVNDFVAQATEQYGAISAEDIGRIGKEQFDQAMRELQQADKYFMARRYFFQTYIISFFVSLIVTVIVRRRKEGEL